jgi:cell division protein FtsA
VGGIKMIVGLDIGTNNVRVAIAQENDDGKLEIIGTHTKTSAGLRNGTIVNIEDAKNAIKEAIEETEQNFGVEILNVHTAVGGTQIESRNSRGVVPVHGDNSNKGEINNNDIDQVIRNATAIMIPEDKQTLNIIPQHYTVDDVGGIKSPSGMIGVRLEVDVHITTISKTIVKNIISCIERAGFQFESIIQKSLAISKAVCYEDEMELGSVIIDLGAGTTDVLVIYDSAPICTISIPVGGNVVTNDIAIVVGIPVVEAERIKIESGCCFEDDIGEDTDVILPGVGGRGPEVILKSQLCQIISARVEQIFEMVREAIKKETCETIKQLSGNIILTGGGAKMDGVIDLAKNVFKTSSVRLGIPEILGNETSDYRSPEFATVIGIVENAFKEPKNSNRVVTKNEKKKENKLLTFFKTFF